MADITRSAVGTGCAGLGGGDVKGATSVQQVAGSTLGLPGGGAFQSPLTEVVPLKEKGHTGARWFIGMDNVTSSMQEPFPWMDLLRSMRMTVVDLCHFHVLAVLPPVMGCFCVMKTYRTRDDIMSKLEVHGCSVVRKLSANFTSKDALFRLMGNAGALVFELGFQAEMKLYAMRAGVEAPALQSMNHAALQSMMQGTCSPLPQLHGHTEPCKKRLLDGGSFKIPPTPPVKKHCATKVAVGTPSSMSDNYSVNGEMNMSSSSSDHDGNDDDDCVQQGVPSAPSDDSWFVQSGDSCNEDDGHSVQGLKRRLESYARLCRNQGNELDKVRRMLNASDSELRSSRKQLSALEEKSHYTRMDLLRLVGDMHSVKSSKVSVHSFRQCNMVYTNYVYQGSKFVSGLGASSPSTAPANTMASAGGQSDAAGYMGGLYAMPVAVKMSRMLSASGKLT